MAAELILLVIGGFLASWAVSLLFRIAGRRYEQTLARRLAAAGKPVPNFVRPSDAVTVTAAFRIAILAFFAGIVVVALAAFLDTLLYGRQMESESLSPWDISAGVVIFIGVGMAVAGLTFDRSRGRARCPKCWYDLDENIRRGDSGDFESLTCPECGYSSGRLADFYRTRRKPRYVLASLLALPLAYTAWKIPSVNKYGPNGLIPNAALIAALPWLPDELIVWNSPGQFRPAPGQPPIPASVGLTSGSLQQRDFEGELAVWQRHLLHWHCEHLWATSHDIGNVCSAHILHYGGFEVPFGLTTDDLVRGLVSADLGDADRAAWLIVTYRDKLELLEESPVARAHAQELVALALGKRGHGNPSIAAMCVLEAAGDAADPFIDPFLAQLEQYQFPGREMQFAHRALAGLAARSDKARQVFLNLLPNSHFLINRLPSIAPHHPELVTAWKSLLTSASPDIAAAAADGAPTGLIPPGVAVDLLLPRLAENPELDDAILRLVARLDIVSPITLPSASALSKVCDAIAPSGPRGGSRPLGSPESASGALKLLTHHVPSEPVHAAIAELLTRLPKEAPERQELETALARTKAH